MNPEMAFHCLQSLPVLQVHFSVVSLSVYVVVLLCCCLNCSHLEVDWGHCRKSDEKLRVSVQGGKCSHRLCNIRDFLCYCKITNTNFNGICST